MYLLCFSVRLPLEYACFFLRLSSFSCYPDSSERFFTVRSNNSFTLQMYRSLVCDNFKKPRSYKRMIKPWLTSLGFLILLLLLVPVVPAYAASGTQTLPAKDYSADRFDAQITVQNDGTLLVKETVVFKFVGGPLTFVYRDVPTDKTDTISIA